MSYCNNKACKLLNSNFRQHCSAFKLGWSEKRIKACPKRRRAREEAFNKTRLEWTKTHTEWWNAYQRFYRHKQKGEIFNPVKVVGQYRGGQILIKDCPFCHGRHKHTRTNKSLKLATCCKGFYEITSIKKEKV
jgi:hypothetical protein